MARSSSLVSGGLAAHAIDKGAAEKLPAVSEQLTRFGKEKEL
jgi:hypothetical protein